MHKILFCFVLFLGVIQLLSGCAANNTPLVLENGFQRKSITLCDNDVYCFRNTYSVIWDQACRANSLGCSSGYPVSYRSKEYVLETGQENHTIQLPDAAEVRMLPEKEAK